MISKIGGLVAAATVATFGMLGSAEAATYKFLNITGNSAVNAATGEAQLSMDVTDAGGGLVSFQFFNSGPNASSITQIYWEDGTPDILNSVQNVISGTGTSFANDPTPPYNLPGSNPIAFVEAFNVDPNAPTQPNGVNPGETVTVIFDLISPGVFSDVITQLDSGALRVGFHVQGFSGGGSESFVNCKASDNCNGGGVGGQIPVPASLPLLLSGLGIGILLNRRKRKLA